MWSTRATLSTTNNYFLWFVHSSPSPDYALVPAACRVGQERLRPHAAPTIAAFLVLETRHAMEHVVEVTEDSPWHVELVVELHGLDGAFVEGRVVLEVLPVDRLGRVVPPLILHNESVRILAMAGLDIPSVPPIVSFFETWLPP